MTDEEKLEKVLQVLINSAEFGELLDPVDLWEAIDERPSAFLSEDALKSFEVLRP